MFVFEDGLSIANFAFAYAVNAGIIRKGCVLRCERSAANHKGDCGGGVVYQTHRHTLITKLKGQLLSPKLTFFLVPLPNTEVRK